MAEKKEQLVLISFFCQCVFNSIIRIFHILTWREFVINLFLHILLQMKINQRE